MISEHKNIFSRRFLLFGFFPSVPLFLITDVEAAPGRIANPARK